MVDYDVTTYSVAWALVCTSHSSLDKDLQQHNVPVSYDCSLLPLVFPSVSLWSQTRDMKLLVLLVFLSHGQCRKCAINGRYTKEKLSRFQFQFFFRELYTSATMRAFPTSQDRVWQLEQILPKETSAPRQDEVNDLLQGRHHLLRLLQGKLEVLNLKNFLIWDNHLNL